MDVYTVPEHGQANAYMIQGTSDPNLQLTSPFLFEPLETMYNDGAPEFVAEQSFYYPSATNYGYICTGYESPNGWDDHHGVFGMDGQNVQYIGTETDNCPYVYYTPSYGYAQSTYNPYNPYIPGAMIGSDGSFLGAQQQYYMPSYENGASSPAYFPMVVQSASDSFTSSTTEQFVDMAASTAKSVHTLGFNHNSVSAAFSSNQGMCASNHSDPFFTTNGLKRYSASNGSVTTNSIPGLVSSQALQGQVGQAIGNLSNRKPLFHHNQLKVAITSSDGPTSFASNGNGGVVAGKVKLPFGRIIDDANGNSNALTGQNRGPRTNTSKAELTVKAYSNKAGNGDAQGNITIRMDQYNKGNFPVEYANAKFFIIKSYSEDDVHKSIKYNVWSSTLNGNKKLNNAYEEAKKITLGSSRHCPVFLFFSVNASGQFCGVAEMIGNVDFHKDMDFWQQDKWSGSFPVKWHIIKDVTNPNFRHIILENNEHKPVTNSRDTQEIAYKKGMEMLKVFKKYVSKTCIVDDFMYYEDRQEAKARLLMNSYRTPVLHPPRLLADSSLQMETQVKGLITVGTIPLDFQALKVTKSCQRKP